MRKTITLFLLVSLIASCTTQKKRNDLSLLGKVYQNTTARYNGYYNAKEIMLATHESMATDHQENYNKLLPLYVYNRPDNPTSYYEDLDKAIEKVTVVINLHRPSHWVDDCYLLMGQAQYLKQDYEGAEQTFRYLVEEYPLGIFDTKTGSKKKGGKTREELKEDRELEKTKAQVKRSKKQNIKKRKKEAKKRSKARKKYNQQVRKNQKRKRQGKKTQSLKKKESNDRKSKKSEQDSVANKIQKIEEEIPENDSVIGMISIFDKEDETIGEGSPESYFLKHRPAYYGGLLWLSKALIERDNYDAADRFLAKLEKDPKVLNDVRKELPPLKAYYYIRQKQYKYALDHLKQAIELASEKENKARYAFIAAQIYQMDGNSSDAYASFKEAIKHSSGNYEMEFNARLNLAQSEWLNGGVSEEEIKKRLERMLKDAKNANYKDRIYFTLAGIALKSGNKAEAIKNLELALKNGTQNKIQKAESYYQLAKLYFEGEEFVRSKRYYDSTAQVLPKTDERYFEVQQYGKKLENVAKFIEEIELQDSLLRISNLSEEDKKKIAFEIKKKQDEERRAALAAAANKSNSRLANVRAASAFGTEERDFLVCLR